MTTFSGTPCNYTIIMKSFKKLSEKCLIILAVAKQKQSPKVPFDIDIQGEKSRKDTTSLRLGNNLNDWSISKSKK